MVIPSTLEQIIPDFLLPEYEQNPYVFRFNKEHSGHGRWYMRWDPDKDSLHSYVSVSTLMNKVIPKGEGFLRWLANNTSEESKRISEETAHFGSVYHREAMKPLIHKTGFDFDWLKEKPSPTAKHSNFVYLFDEKFREEVPKWRYGFERGLMSWFRFCAERIEKVIAVEIPLYSDKYGVAATLDLVCLMRFNKKVHLAIIDLKSKMFYLHSKTVDKKFYETHRFQLFVQRELLSERYPGMIEEYAEGDIENVMMFNYSPVNWKATYDKEEKAYKGGPSWTLTNHTGEENNEWCRPAPVKRNRRLKLGHLKLHEAIALGLPKPPNMVLEVKGSFEHLGEFDWTKHVHIAEL